MLGRVYARTILKRTSGFSMNGCRHLQYTQHATIPWAPSRTQGWPLGYKMFHSHSPLRSSSEPTPPQKPTAPEQPATKPSILSQLPSIFKKSPETASSFRKIVALAKPERKPLLMAIGLLLVSSSVSMSIPFTIGKLIDFFSTTNPVCIVIMIPGSFV